MPLQASALAQAQSHASGESPPCGTEFCWMNPLQQCGQQMEPSPVPPQASALAQAQSQASGEYSSVPVWSACPALATARVSSQAAIAMDPFRPLLVKHTN